MHSLFQQASGLTEAIIASAIEVHRDKGPGLIESIYEWCLLRELGLRRLACVSQKSVLIEYKGFTREEPLRFDVLVEGCVLVEAKAVENILPIQACQTKLGRTPGAPAFYKTAGVKNSEVPYYWPSHSALAKEAGGQPNKFKGRLDGVIIDAKVRTNGYILGTKDRKFLDYAVTHGAELLRQGFEKIYLVVVGPSFRDSDLTKLGNYLSQTAVRSVVLITARALLRKVEQSIRDRSTFSLSQLTTELFGNKIISS